MKWTGLNEIREKYLTFFETKGHLRHKSFPLVPINDKSILLINAGMTPLKKYFTGELEPPRHRMTTCQKCIRTPDIDSVGITARHGTYFEMLGNFSFGQTGQKIRLAQAPLAVSGPQPAIAGFVADAVRLLQPAGALRPQALRHGHQRHRPRRRKC